MTSLVRKAKKIASSSSNPSHHAAEVVFQCASVVNRVKLLGMCYDSEESASADTRKHVSVATDALQEAPRTLQSLCQEDSQNVEGDVQQNLFELDELVIELTDIIEKFKEQFDTEKKSTETKKVENEAVLNTLFLLNAQMRQLDEARSILNSTSFENAEDASDVSPIFYDRILEKTANIHSLVSNNDGSNSNVSPGSVNRLEKILSLLQDLMHDTMAASKSSGWQTEEEKVTLLNHLKTVYENAYQFISLSTTSATVAEQENINVKEGFLESLEEFTNVVRSFHEHKNIVTLTESNISESLLRVDAMLESSQENTATARKMRVGEALRHLNAVTESLNDMEDVLKNIHPDTCYYPERLREFAGCLCAAFRTTCDGWAGFYELDSDLIDDVTMRKIHSGLLELGYSNTELIKTWVASATRMDDTAFPTACRNVLQKVRMSVRKLRKNGVDDLSDLNSIGRVFSIGFPT